MRYVLLPVQLPKWCGLNDAVHWVRARIYPLGLRYENVQAEALGAEFPFDPDEQPAELRKAHLLARERLIANLMTGKLTARGAGVDSPAPEEKQKDGWNEGLYIMLAHSSGSAREVEIPPSEWSMSGFEWLHETLHGTDKLYSDIVVPVEDLLKVFPEQPAAEVLVEKRGDIFLVEGSGSQVADEDGRRARNAGGRPRVYDWNSFNLEIIMIANGRDGLPDIQADLERHMLD
jgi:hypothetical protein